MAFRTHGQGLEGMFLDIRCVASNDGYDKRKRWETIWVRGPNGECWEVVASKGGMTVTQTTPPQNKKAPPKRGEDDAE